MLQFLQPFREDSLSYLAWAARHGIVLPAFIGFLAAAVTLANVSLTGHGTGADEGPA